MGHQAEGIVQMAIIAKERRQNQAHAAGPSSATDPYIDLVDDMVCDSAHSSFSTEKLSKIPRSKSSSTNLEISDWIDKVCSKRKRTAADQYSSCGECAAECLCRRAISFLAAKMKGLSKNASDKKKDDDNKWKYMKKKLEELSNLIKSTGITKPIGPRMELANHPVPSPSAATPSTPYGAPHLGHPHIHPTYTPNVATAFAEFTNPVGFSTYIHTGTMYTYEMSFSCVIVLGHVAISNPGIWGSIIFFIAPALCCPCLLFFALT